MQQFPIISMEFYTSEVKYDTLILRINSDQRQASTVLT